MLARVRMLLPFDLILQTDVEYDRLHFSTEGYEVLFHPPYRAITTRSELSWTSLATTSEIFEGLLPLVPQFSAAVLANGQPTIVANALLFDFCRETFDPSGSGSSGDPPDSAIYEAANFVLLRVKAYARAVDIKPVGVNTVTWRLDYLTEGLSKMPGAHPVVWDRSSIAVRGSYGITPAKVWNSLPDGRTDTPGTARPY
jgi:hypothetical protein